MAASQSTKSFAWSLYLDRLRHRRALIDSGGLTIERERDLRHAVAEVWEHGGRIFVDSLGIWVRGSGRCVDIGFDADIGGFAGFVGPFASGADAYIESAEKIDRYLLD